MTIEKKTIVKDYRNILDNMKEIDNHYCFNCKSNFSFLKMIEIDNEMNYVCPYCYSKDFVDKSYMIKEITVNKFKKNTRYVSFTKRLEKIENERKIKQKKRVSKIVKRNIRMVLFIFCLFAFFPFSLIGLGFWIFLKLKKNHIKKYYPNRYKILYGVD